MELFKNCPVSNFRLDCFKLGIILLNLQTTFNLNLLTYDVFGYQSYRSRNKTFLWSLDAIEIQFLGTCTPGTGI